MKYCCKYRPHFAYENEIDELTIDFKRKDTTLLDFLLLHQNQRINIKIWDTQDFLENNSQELFFAIVKEHPEANFALVLPSYEQELVPKIYEALRANSEVKIPIFFSEFVNDWDTLHGYLELEPCDMYIVENLGFDLADVSTTLHAHNCRVRCFPNVAQSRWKQTPALKKFFIRPEDIDYYSKFIDVCEFFGREASLETLYRIYTKDKKWMGPLKELILDFEDDIDGRGIDSMFFMRRANCKKKCFIEGRECHICEAIKELSGTLIEHDLIVKH